MKAPAAKTTHAKKHSKTTHAKKAAPAKAATPSAS